MSNGLQLCFFQQDFTVKVADLGEAREMYETCDTEDLPSPALNWAPPEASICKTVAKFVIFINVSACFLLFTSTDAESCVLGT